MLRDSYGWARSTLLDRRWITCSSVDPDKIIKVACQIWMALLWDTFKPHVIFIAKALLNMDAIRAKGYKASDRELEKDAHKHPVPWAKVKRNAHAPVMATAPGLAPEYSDRLGFQIWNPGTTQDLLLDFKSMTLRTYTVQILTWLTFHIHTQGAWTVKPVMLIICYPAKSNFYQIAFKRVHANRTL
jgi:hypothetical protein